MANRPKAKMSPADRAKQFVPFSPLKGLDAALKEKERILVEKIELSEEEGGKLSQKLACIKKGMKVKTVYYSDGEYISEEGIVCAIDKVFRKLTIVKTEINMDDILKIEGPSLCDDEYI